MGDFVPQTPYWGFAPGPHWGTSVPQTSCPPFVLAFQLEVGSKFSCGGEGRVCGGGPSIS